MSEAENIFNAFYSKFVLRDFFGKIIPGSIILLSVAIALTSLSNTLTFIIRMSGWMWLFATGFSWISGFAVQSLGEGWLIRYYPRNKRLTRQQFYEILIRFDQRSVSSPIERQQVERIVVIKEACGNSYVALGISLLILFAEGLFDRVRSGCPIVPWAYSELIRLAPFIIITIVAIIFLGIMHFRHVSRQYDYMDVFLSLPQPTNTEDST